jgi:hypothetical protein
MRQEVKIMHRCLMTISHNLLEVVSAPISGDVDIQGEPVEMGEPGVMLVCSGLHGFHQ